MQPESNRSELVRRVAAKEVTLFFASPVAYLFLAAFAAVTLFVFFWGEAFFSRNIADVRPLFEWMPVLLIFLASTLTMRLWSEERRTGTLEHVLTQPAPLWCFVLGKFLGCLVLLLGPCPCRLPGDVSTGRGVPEHRPVRVRAQQQPDRQPDYRRRSLRRTLYRGHAHIDRAGGQPRG